jgi:3-hydroxybutyryl-CoA dehydrogenase
MEQVDSVVVIGGGIMGCDVAAIFLTNGCDVQIVEPSAAARNTLQKRCMQACHALGHDEPQGRLDALARPSDIVWSDVSIVIECAPEKLEVKQRVFAELESLAPAHVPLTSNSSSLPISSIGAGLKTRPRMLGLHFFMPAHLVPAVEVVRSDVSDEAVALKVSDIMRRVGKKPVQVKKDVPGFLANRIQHALMREAISLVEQGFASAEDVDVAVRYGFGFRYIAAGPLLQKDLAGIDIHYAAAATMYPYLNADTTPSPLMQQLVERGDTGVKSPAKRGFYDWDDASIAKARARYETALLKATQILRDEEIS